MTANMNNQEVFPILINLQGNYHPPVFDLSGTVPFELYLHIRRSAVHETDPRHLVFLSTGSVFDLPAALDKGLVELIDEASGEVVRHHYNANLVQKDTAVTSEAFVTLPTDVPGKDRLIRTVPLHAALYLRALVQPGHKYSLRLRHKDLGVQWWAWGDPPESPRNGAQLPCTETQRLVSNSPSLYRRFSVVSEIAMPPKLSIGLSLAGEAHTQKKGSGAGSEAPSPTIQITITIINTNDQPITLKTSGGQPHLHTPGEIPNPRARVTAQLPDVQNFSVIDYDTQEELISDTPFFIFPVAGGNSRGWPWKQFLTLAPQESVTRTVTLPGRKLAAGKEYRVRLRPTGCWWAYGTLDDLFGGSNAVSMQWPAGPKPRMSLASDDVVVFRC